MNFHCPHSPRAAALECCLMASSYRAELVCSGAKQASQRGYFLLIAGCLRARKPRASSCFIEAAPYSSTTFLFRNCLPGCGRRVWPSFFSRLSSTDKAHLIHGVTATLWMAFLECRRQMIRLPFAMALGFFLSMHVFLTWLATLRDLQICKVVRTSLIRPARLQKNARLVILVKNPITRAP